MATSSSGRFSLGHALGHTKGKSASRSKLQSQIKDDVHDGQQLGLFKKIEFLKKPANFT